MNFPGYWHVYASESLNPGRPALPANVLEAVLDSWAQLGVQHAIPVTGDSMWPTIRDGDRVWIAHGAERARRGDVIVYRAGERMVIHRVVAEEWREKRRRFITRGDNSQCADPPVELSQIVGEVIAVERNGSTRRMPGGELRWLQWLLARGLARLRTLCKAVL